MSDKPKQSVWSDFWLGEDVEDESYLPFDEDLVFKAKDSNYDTGVFDESTLKMASGRRAIANFVNILTGEDIPVYFWGGNRTGATDGKVVYLSANIINKSDFDPAVGLALHEGSHILLTDFDLIKTLWGRISELYKLGKDIGIDKDRVRGFTKLMVNWVEDRFIDDYIFRTAPGYRPYYTALYDKYFNNIEISKSLQSKLMRQPTLLSYEARIINLTNPMTDLNALPGLHKIAEEVSLKTISRLKTTKDRIKVAVEITKIVFSNIKDFIDKQKQSGMGHDTDPKNKQSKHEIFFDIRVEDPSDKEDGGEGTPVEKPDGSDEGEENGKSGGNKDEGESDHPKNPEEESEDDVIGGIKNDGKDSESDKAEEKKEELGDTSDTTKKQLKKIKVAIDTQKQFLEDHGNVEKKAVTDKQKQLLDAIEKSGIILVPVGIDLTPANTPAFGIECVVVKKLTKELMFSGMFPLTRSTRVDTDPPRNVNDAVIKGIQLGNMLGKKLQIRQETNVTKYMRRKSGKIDKRTLADFFWGSESVFYKVKYDKYNKLNIHISVDASSSMSESGKWEQTMTMVVAICKAVSMISNIHVSVSFRCTIERMGGIHSWSNSLLPYVVMAYDSSKDKFSKVKNLFPYLQPNGATPEGLAFEATMDELVCKRPGENHYFLTISDGEPCFSYYGPNNVHVEYNMNSGAEHTRKQYNKIRQSGVRGMAYFIKSNRNAYMGSSTSENAHEKCFKRMYGKDARFIDVGNVTPIAKTMNGLFLNKD